MQKACDAGSAEDYHEWRKRVKYHWYHTRLLQAAWPPVLEVRASELKQLSDYLGDDHDLVVLQSTLQSTADKFGPPKTIETFCALARQQQNNLRSAAQDLGVRLYTEKPGRHTRRLRGYWLAWQTSGEEPSHDA